MAPKPKPPVCEYAGPMEGEGTFFYANGATYCGHWKMVVPPENTPAPTDGTTVKPTRVRHGKGTYKDGSYIFEGEFTDDAMHGQGRFVYASGAEYTGEWQSNKYNGKGRYMWPDGKYYEGDFVDNVMHGKGCIHDTKGRSWSGVFSQGSGPGLSYDLP